METHRIKRDPDITYEIRMIGAYVAEDQLIYIFATKRRDQWVEHNYATGEWHEILLVDEE